MKKFASVCSSGLGSSFMVEMNIKQVLNELGVKDFEVLHSDIGGASSDMADYFIVGKDLENAASHLDELFVVNSIIDINELRDVLKGIVERDGLV